ncbi:MAG: T9SS type A sorting domain-containing protein [Bacteroidia bacterium]|nr:T9SS type A sorting domain-containing protein [Bacteroidia bacterium]
MKKTFKTIKIIAVAGFLLLIIDAHLFAQYTFDWMQPSGNYSKTSVMSVVDNSNNLIVTGYWQNYQTFTRKYDLSGSLLWEVADSSGLSGKYEKPNWINCDSNNNIFVVGNRYSFSASTQWDYPDAIIAIKYSPSGALQWRKEIPITITLTSLHRFNTSSQVDSKGNLYIGTSIDNPSGAVLYKLDANGNLIFTGSSNVNSPQNFSSMRLKGDKIVMATGSTISNIAPVFVWDTTGSLLWTAAVTGRGSADAEIDESHHVYVLSHLLNEVSPASGADMNISKFDSAGNPLWIRDYDFGGYEIPTRMVYLNNRLSIIGYGPSSPSTAYFDWKTLQTDTSGTLLWHAIYDATTFNDEQPYNLVAKPNGEVIVTGKGGPSPDPFNPSFIQMPIVQYSNTGSQLWLDTPNIYGGWGLACTLASDSSLYIISSSDMTVYHYKNVSLEIENGFLLSHSVTVYPNPFSSFTTLELNLKETKDVSVTIIDASGKSVMTILPQMLQKGLNNINLDLTELSSGVFFCIIKSNENLHTIKLLKN